MNWSSIAVLFAVLAFAGLAAWRAVRKGAPCSCGCSRADCGASCHCHDRPPPDAEKSNTCESPLAQ